MITTGDFNLLLSKVKKYSFETVDEANTVKLAVLDSMILTASKVIQLKQLKAEVVVDDNEIIESVVEGVEAPKVLTNTEIHANQIENATANLKYIISSMLLNLAGLTNYLSIKLKVNEVSETDTTDVCLVCFRLSKLIIDIEVVDYVSEIKYNTEAIQNFLNSFCQFLVANDVDISINDVTSHLS